MPIVIVNRRDETDREGLLGKAALPANAIIKVCSINPKARYCNANINICNPNATPAEVKLWISSAPEPQLEDLFEPRIVLNPDAVYVRTNLVFGKQEAIYVLSSLEGVVIRIDGYENNPL